ncbi:MAG: hypothetical protein IJU42_07385 [Erysipelotrichaceae bacterium]|nr:hypothetical protein [Erysipelotrichaceae bacterium]
MEQNNKKEIFEEIENDPDDVKGTKKSGKINLKDAMSFAKNVASKTSEAAKKAANASKPVLQKAGEKATAAKDAGLELAEKGKQELTKALDKNGNGEIDIEDIIIIGINTPGVKIDRKDFLKRELSRYYPENVIDKAIEETPAKAGIKPEDLDKICDEVIKKERNVVSGVSAALGIPGGAAMLATIPADVAQYYGCMLRVMQEELYLYGFPQINVDNNGSVLDSETLNLITICLGTMYGVAGANNALKSLSKALAAGVEKKIISTALTKGKLYPTIKAIVKWFNVSLTKKMLGEFAKNSIPIAGAIIGGGLTFATFKPCCDRLKDSLKETRLANPELNDDTDIIDLEINGEEE